MKICTYGVRRARSAPVLRSGSVFLAAVGCATIFVGELLTSSSAHSQAATPIAQSASEDTTLLEEIVVTARKRGEDIQSIPESVDVINERELANAHVTRLDDIGTLVSNVNITTRADQTPDVVLRGVGSFGVVQGVGFYANDVQLFEGQTVRPQDLQRIEVLKGPQGTLYGGSNIGGAIKYVTKPATSVPEAEVSLEVGNFRTHTISAAVSGPIVANDALNARVSYFETSTGGYQYDPILLRMLDESKEQGARVTLESDHDSGKVALYLYADLLSGGTSSLYYRPSSPSDYTLQLKDGSRPLYRRDVFSATLETDQQLSDNVAFTSLTNGFRSYGHSVTDTDKGPLPFLTGYRNFGRTVYSQELRLANTGNSAFEWLVGAFAEANNPYIVARDVSFQGDPGDPASLADPAAYVTSLTRPEQQHHEYALFGQASYAISAWTIEAGARVDYNDSSMIDRVVGIYGSQHQTEVLPKATVSYHLNSDDMVYATGSKGFEPGDLTEGFDALGNAVIVPYKAETAWSYELGFKGTFWKRVRFKSALFYINYENRLFQTNVYESGNFVNVTENIGESKNYGVEFDLTLPLTKELLFSVNYGYTKAVWGNVPIYDSDLSAYTNLSGRLAPFTPQYQATVSLDWNHQLPDGYIIGARADANFIGRTYWDVTDHYWQAAYQVVNFGLRFGKGPWEASAHVFNALDERYNTVWISGPELGAPFNVGGIGRPRLYTMQFTYKF